MGYYLSPCTWGGSALYPRWNAIFAPNEIVGQGDVETVVAQTLGGPGQYVDVAQRGRQFAIWLTTASGTAQERREDVGRMFDNTAGLVELMAADSSGSQRTIQCKALDMFAHPESGKTLIVRLEAPDPRWQDKTETVATSALSTATPIVRGFKRLSASAGYSQAVVYDTELDSDKGNWRSDENAKTTSWYRALGTPPKRMMIEWNVGPGLASINIRDADSGSLYCTFDSNASKMIFGGTGIADIAARDGVLYLAKGGQGVVAVSFPDDAARHIGSGVDETFKGDISQRNSTLGFSGDGGLRVNNATANDLSGTNWMLGGTKIAAATASALSIWDVNGGAVYDFGDKAYSDAWLSQNGDLWAYSSTNTRLESYFNAGMATADNATPDLAFTPATTPALWGASPMPTVNAIVGASRLSAADGRSDIIFLGHNSGVTRLDVNQSSSQLSVVQYITASYTSELMAADTRGMWTFHEGASANLAAGASLSSVAATVISSCVHNAKLIVNSATVTACGTAPRGVALDISTGRRLTSEIKTGTSTSQSNSKLVNSAGAFNDGSLEAGDDVWNTTASTTATVSSVDSATQLTLSSNIFSTSPATYSIQSGGLNVSSCQMMVGTWFLPDTGLNTVIMSKWDIATASPKSWRLVIQNAASLVQFDVSSNGSALSACAYSTCPMAFGSWNFIAGVADGSTISVFHDGLIGASTTTFTGCIADSRTPFIVGGQYNASAFTSTPDGRFAGPFLTTWSGSEFDWRAFLNRAYNEGKRALQLSGSLQKAALYGGISSCVNALALSRDRQALAVGTGSPGGAVSFLEWASSYRYSEYDGTAASTTDDAGSNVRFGEVQRLSWHGDIVAIGGSSTGSAANVYAEEHFTRAISVSNLGNVEADVSIAFKPTMDKMATWHKARRLEVLNRADVYLRDYPVMLEFDTASPITDGKMQSDADDLRVVLDGREIPRRLHNLNAASSHVWFNVDLAPRERKEGYLIYGNPYSLAPEVPWAGEPAFAWDSGSADNNTWPYVDFGSVKVKQVMAWEPTMMLPTTNAENLDYGWVSRTQGGGGGIGEISTLRFTIATDAQDTMDRGNAATYSSSGHLYLGKVGGNSSSAWTTGFRFASVTIPASAIILSARVEVRCRQELNENYLVAQGFTASSNRPASIVMRLLEFSPDRGDRGEARLRVYAEAADDSAAFTSTARPTQRTKTTNYVDWDVVGWTDFARKSPGGGWVENRVYESPNLAKPIQEVINRSGWASGNDLTFIVADDGSYGEVKRLQLYDAPGVPTRNPITGDTDYVNVWFPAHRKIYNQSAVLRIEYRQSITSTPMAEVDPWNDIAVGHKRDAIRTGEPSRNAWKLANPIGITQIEHAGAFRLTSQIGVPGAASPTHVTTDDTNVSWASGSKYFAVSALNEKGETTLGSEGSVATAASNTGHAIRVNWKGARRASGYRVYRGTSPSTYDTYYEVANATTFLDKNDPGLTAISPSTNTATVNAAKLNFRNQHGKLVALYQSSASTDSAVAGWGVYPAYIYSYDSTGGGTFTNNASEVGFTYWPSSPSNGDMFYAGAASVFYGIGFNVGTAGSYTNTASWQYWNGAWTTFTPAYDDTTASDFSWKRSGSGAVGWDDGDVGSWAATTINSVSAFWVRAALGSGTVTTNAAQATVKAGPLTTPVTALAFPSDIAIFEVELDATTVADGQGAFINQALVRLDSEKTPVVTTGCEFSLYPLDATIRVHNDLPNDYVEARVQDFLAQNDRPAIVSSTSGLAIDLATGNRLPVARDKVRRKLLKLTPGVNRVQFAEDAGTTGCAVVRYRNSWN